MSSSLPTGFSSHSISSAIFSSVKALIGFEKVRELDLLVLVHLFPWQAELSNIKPLYILYFSLNLLFNKLGLRGTVPDRPLADLQPSRLGDVLSVEQRKLKLLSFIHDLKSAA